MKLAETEEEAVAECRKRDDPPIITSSAVGGSRNHHPESGACL